VGSNKRAWNSEDFESESEFKPLSSILRKAVALALLMRRQRPLWTVGFEPRGGGPTSGQSLRGQPFASGVVCFVAPALYKRGRLNGAESFDQDHLVIHDEVRVFEAAAKTESSDER